MSKDEIIEIQEEIISLYRYISSGTIAPEIKREVLEDIKKLTKKINN